MKLRRPPREDLPPPPKKSSYPDQVIRKKGIKSGRPKGKAPQGKRWNFELKCWEVDLALPQPFDGQYNLYMPRPWAGRPPGSSPKGKRWSVHQQGWEDDPGYSAPEIRKPSVFVGVEPWEYHVVKASNRRVYDSDKWGFKIGGNKNRCRFGPFDTEEEAARAYDALAGPQGKPVNFPAADSSQTQAVKGAKSSQFRGVSWHSASKLWSVSIKVNGKTINLGYFKDQKSAARKFDEAARPLGRPTNFPLEDGGSAVAAPVLPPALPNLADEHGGTAMI